MQTGFTAVCRKRFDAYAASFAAPDGGFPFGIRIKIGHTADVCRIMEDLTPPDTDERTGQMLYLTALCHDISRFEQYQKFQTFRDSDSFDHGERSAELIRSEKILEGLPEEEIAIISEAVRLHNRITLPETCPGGVQRLVAELIRDADKLAILELLIRFFQSPPELAEAAATKMDLPETPGWTKDVLAAAVAGRQIRHCELKNVNDFKLMLFTWIHDFNSPLTAEYALTHNLYPTARTLLPADPAMDHLLELTQQFLEKKAKEQINYGEYR